MNRITQSFIRTSRRSHLTNSGSLWGNLRNDCFLSPIFVGRQTLFSPSKKTQMAEKTNFHCGKVLIVGLGNIDHPGTRHSVGMHVVDHLATALGVRWTKDRKNCLGYVVNFTNVDGTQIVMLKPKVPMNVNGTSVLKTVRLFDIKKEEILLVQDDIDKKLGKLTIKQNGSAGGHNGVRSVINCLGTNEIARLKIGIDRPACKDEVVNYVLGKFTSEERQVINEATEKSTTVIRDYLKQHCGVNLCSDLDRMNEEE